MEDMPRSESPRKPTVRVGVIQMKAGIDPRRIVSDPPAVVLDVRSIWMAGRVAESGFRLATLFGNPLFGRALDRVLLGASVGRRTVRRDVPTAEATSALLLAASLLL